VTDVHIDDGPEIALPIDGVGDYADILTAWWTGGYARV